MLRQKTSNKKHFIKLLTLAVYSVISLAGSSMVFADSANPCHPELDTPPGKPLSTTKIYGTTQLADCEACLGKTGTDLSACVACHPAAADFPGQPLGSLSINNSDAVKSCQECNVNGADLTTCLKDNSIVKDINVFVNFLSGVAGLAIVGSLIFGGVQYSMAGGSSDATSKAKARITNSAIAFAAFLLIFAFVQWLIPGGVFK